MKREEVEPVAAVLKIINLHWEWQRLTGLGMSTSERKLRDGQYAPNLASGETLP